MRTASTLTRGREDGPLTRGLNGIYQTARTLDRDDEWYVSDDEPEADTARAWFDDMLLTGLRFRDTIMQRHIDEGKRHGQRHGRIAAWPREYDE